MTKRAATLEPARIDFDGGGPPRSGTYGDLYHPHEGARGQAQHVFLAGNDLPARWQGRSDFTIVETGFGLGHNFLAAWAAWRDDPNRCARLHLVSIEAHPARREDLARALAGSAEPGLAHALIGAWPEPEAGLHLLEFEDGAVRLWLALGDVLDWLPRLRVRADAIFLDGFAPARNPRMWTPRVFEALGRLAAPLATAATWSAARAVREGLARAGFEVQAAPGFGRKRDMTRAVHVPRRPERAPGPMPLAWPPAATTAPGSERAFLSPLTRHALVIGGGLAGAAAADALARSGWRCTVLERQPAPAGEASGNPAGIFHGATGHGEHRHSEFLAQAARLACPRYRHFIAQGQVRGQADGLVHGGRGDSRGGWVVPGDLVRCWLGTAGVTLRTSSPVQALRQEEGQWRAFGPDGQCLSQGDIVVLAGGVDLPALLRLAGAQPPEARPVRGQLSWVEQPDVLAQPMTGQGYALSLPDGRLVFGATAHPDDLDPSLRPSDHAWNLQRLQALTGIELPRGQAWAGRVAWRCAAPDRLPWVGAAPRGTESGEAPLPARLDRPLLVARATGLYMLGGLGSRGLTWGPLAGEILAAWVDDAPMPEEADLLDAVDPARAVVRRARQASASR